MGLSTFHGPGSTRNRQIKQSPQKKPQLRSAGHFLTLNNCRDQEKWHLFQRQTLKEVSTKYCFTGITGIIIYWSNGYVKYGEKKSTAQT